MSADFVVIGDYGHSCWR